MTYGYFYQGGGWNQNSRFALTRALVESREPWIDHYVVYAANGPKGSPLLRRLPVENGVFTDAGRTFALAWWTADDARTPMAADAPKDARLAPVDWAAVSGDLAFARGHIHPNKAPGASFLAVPGYALVFGVERLFGIDPDAAIVLNVNAWLTGLLSVGLLSALGVVLFFRLALRFSNGEAGGALAATLAFAFGSLYFPYATMLYEHDLVAAFLLAAFALAFDARTPSRWFAAGACAGGAVASSYLAVVGLAILGVYVVWRGRRVSRALAFAAGAIPPLAVLAAYNVACFGTVLTTNYAWQNPLFVQAGGGLAALFTAPRFDVLAALLVSPFRGVFTGSPVLVLGAIGLVVMLRGTHLRAEGLVCAAMFAHLLVFNMSFANWNGGWGCGPRYLIPALPFLALPIAVISGPAEVDPTRAAGDLDRRNGDRDDRRSTAPRVDGRDLEAQPDLDDRSLPARNRPPGSFTSTSLPDEYVKRRVERVSANSGGIYEGTDGRFFALDTQGKRASARSTRGEAALPGEQAQRGAVAAAGFGVCGAALSRA